MNGWITAGLALAVAVASGLAVHRYDQAQHDRAVADLRRDAAITLADQTEDVLRLLQAEIDRSAALEARSAQLSDQTARAQADGQRLSADLDAVHQRLRQLARSGGGGGDTAQGQASAGTGNCEVVRAALARAAAALELYKSEGDGIAELGQHAVDVATVAAENARQREAGHE